MKLETQKCRREGTQCDGVGIRIEAKDVQGQGLSLSPGEQKVNRRSHKVILRQKEENLIICMYSQNRGVVLSIISSIHPVRGLECSSGG